MSVIVVVRDKKKTVKKHRKVKIFFLFTYNKITTNLTYRFFQNSDESGFSSIEEETELQPAKKRKSRAIREEDLTNEERMRSEVITALYAKYKFVTHTMPCYIQDNRHLQLNPARLQLWAREIV